MEFLIFALMITAYSKVYELAKGKAASLALFMSIVLLYAFLPSLQFEVGTDYQSYYESVYNDQRSLIFYRKGEFLFYYLIKFIEFYSLDPQLLFVFSSLIQGVLFANILRVFRRQGYSIALMALLFIIVTGIYHNQLNGIRNYIAILTFVNFCIYLAEFKYKKTAFLAVLGMLFHQSFILAALLVLPVVFFKKLFIKNFVLLYFILLFTFASGLPAYFLEELVNYFAPFYSHYLESSSTVSVTNVFTRLVYLPFSLIFVFLFYRIMSKGISNFESSVISIWLFSSSIFFLLLYWAAFFRLVGYFAFFSIFPIYYIINSKLFKKEFKWIFLMYVLFLYVPKVTVFAAGEYKYNSIISVQNVK